MPKTKCDVAEGPMINNFYIKLGSDCTVHKLVLASKSAVSDFRYIYYCWYDKHLCPGDAILVVYVCKWCVRYNLAYWIKTNFMWNGPNYVAYRASTGSAWLGLLTIFGRVIPSLKFMLKLISHQYVLLYYFSRRVNVDSWSRFRMWTSYFLINMD